MKIVWSDFASKTPTEIYKYHKKVAGENVARKIKTNIFSSTNQLLKHPQSGQIEMSLKKLMRNIDIWYLETIKLYIKKLLKVF